jgi:hypothetical protein
VVLPGDLGHEADLDAGLQGSAAVAVEHIHLVSLGEVIQDDLVQFMIHLGCHGTIYTTPPDLN